jgi:hypothetical protein
MYKNKYIEYFLTKLSLENGGLEVANENMLVLKKISSQPDYNIR